MAITTSGTSITFNDSTTQTTAPYYFPTGTAMLFQQTSAPTGWTKVTAYNDYAIRIVSGTASTGGSTAFSTVFTNQTPTISVSVSGLSAGATTLSTSQIPSHTHTIAGNTSVGGSGSTIFMGGRTCCGTCQSTTSNATGSGGSHTHSISGSATGSSSAVTLAVQYVDHIIATKN